MPVINHNNKQTNKALSSLWLFSDGHLTHHNFILFLGSVQDLIIKRPLFCTDFKPARNVPSLIG